MKHHVTLRDFVQIIPLEHPALRLSSGRIFMSSISSLWSQIGGSNYAIANSMMDSKAIECFKSGTRACSIQFGPFSETGMAKEYTKSLSLIGMHPNRPVEIMSMILNSQPPLSLIAKLDKHLMIHIMSAKGAWNLMDALVGHAVASGNDHIATGETEHRVFDDHALRDLVESTIRPFNGANQDEVNFQNIDSIGAVEVATSLSKLIGKQLPTTLIYDHPSIDSIVKMISNADIGAQSLKLSPTVAFKGQNASNKLHMSEYTESPHSGNSLDQHRDERDSISLVPMTRWDIDRTQVRVQFAYYLHFGLLVCH